MSDKVHGHETTPLVKKAVIADSEAPVEHAIDRLPSFRDDMFDTVKLGVPIFISMLSWVGMKTTDTALLGHVSSESLSAAALSDLWTMCTGILIQGRVLDILVGGAVGAGNPKLAGVYLQVAYAVISSVSIFVVLAWNLTERVWIAFGSDAEISAMAGYYASVLSISIPGQMLFSQLSQFFSAQRIMHPEVNASTFGMVCNLIFGLMFVLGFFIPGFDGFGFAACPWVTTSAVYVQLLFVYIIYIHGQRLHEPCWGGWSLEEITTSRIKTFCELYFPSAFGIASDFWRVAVIGTMAARLGEEEVAIFNTSYRIMWIVLVLVMSLSGASGINMSIRLGRLDSHGAKQAGHVGVGMASAACLLIGSVVWLQIRSFGRIFTNDEKFLDMFAETRTPFCITLVLMNVAIAIEKIPYSMGRTKEVFFYGLVASWGGQVPAVYLCMNYWRNDLIGLYTGMAIGYGVLVVLYSFIAFTSDWKKYAELARLRSESSLGASED